MSRRLGRIVLPEDDKKYPQPPFLLLTVLMTTSVHSAGPSNCRGTGRFGEYSNADDGKTRPRLMKRGKDQELFQALLSHFFQMTFGIGMSRHIFLQTLFLSGYFVQDLFLFFGNHQFYHSSGMIRLL